VRMRVTQNDKACFRGNDSIVNEKENNITVGVFITHSLVPRVWNLCFSKENENKYERETKCHGS